MDSSAHDWLILRLNEDGSMTLTAREAAELLAMVKGEKRT